MAEQTVIIEFKADTTGLEPAAKALRSLNQISDEQLKAFEQANAKAQQALSKTAKEAETQFQKVATAVKDVSKNVATGLVLDKSSEVVKTVSATQSLRQQLREATKEAQALAQQYGQLDERALAAARKAATLKENIDDANAAIRALNPEAKFNSIIQLGGAIAGAFGGAQAAIALFGGESELAKRAAENFQKVIAVSQGLNSILSLKDAFTNLRASIGAATVATNAKVAADNVSTATSQANAGAMIAQGAAAETATTANKAFTASLIGTGVGLALVAVLGAIAFAYSRIAAEAEAAADRQERIKNNAADLRQSEADLQAERDRNRAKEQEDFKFQQQRNDLQRQFVKENTQLFVEQRQAREELAQSDTKLLELQQRLANVPKLQGLEAKERAQLQARITDEINAEREKNDQLTIIRNQADQKITTALQIFRERNKGVYIEETAFRKGQGEKEVKDRQKANSDIFANAKATSEQLKALDFGIANQRDFQNASKLINQFYSGLELNAQRFSANSQELDINLTEIKAQNLEQQIQAAKLYFQDTTELEKQYEITIRSLEDKKLQYREQTNRKKIENERATINALLQAELALARTPEERQRVEIAILNETSRQRIEDIDAANDAEVAAINYKYDRMVKAAKDNAELIKAINDKRNKDIADANKKADALGLAQALSNSNAITQTTQTGANQIVDIEEHKRDLRYAIALESADLIGGVLQDSLAAEVEAINEQLAQTRSFYDEQLERNQDRLNKEIISKREAARIEKQLLAQREKAEQDAAKRTAEIKRRADLANRAQKLFEIGIATARNIVEAAKEPALIPFYIALGALQTAAVLAAPLPKYAKGTLSLQRGNNPAGVDTIPILANEGEAITPTREAKEYNRTLKAIHSREIPSFVLNDFVRSYSVKAFPEYNSSTTVYNAELDYAKLAREVAWELKDHKTVMRSGFKQLAEALNGGSVEQNYRLRA